MSPVMVRSGSSLGHRARPKSVIQRLPSGVDHQVRRLDVAVDHAHGWWACSRASAAWMPSRATVWKNCGLWVEASVEMTAAVGGRCRWREA